MERGAAGLGLRTGGDDELDTVEAAEFAGELLGVREIEDEERGGRARGVGRGGDGAGERERVDGVVDDEIERSRQLVAGSMRRPPKLKRKSLVKGTKIKVTCSIDSKVKADLVVSKTVAKKLKLKAKKGAKTVSIGSATGSCKAAGGGSLKLKLSKKAKKAVLKPKKAVSATINLTFSSGGVPNATATAKAKLR